jgi:CDP-6-deoxy-D-xylo-4-hexulose-3-dehydrase
MHAVIDSGWLTAGPVNAKFEQALADYIGVPHLLTCNSGSSANLLAIAALFATQHLQPGDKVRVPAMSFPTTVNPLILYGAVPVLVDVDPATMCPVEPVDVAAHPLGNPIPAALTPPLLEDCCDALGSLDETGLHVGKHALVGTCSFFPAHHITTGEGGAVWTSDPEIFRALQNIRDWGRDCWCAPGDNNTCGMRFDWHFPPLPPRYDHKYTITHLGYNLKMTEVQAACGLAQMARLPNFVELRRRNYVHLLRRLADLEEFIILPEETAGGRASWFGFPFTLREEGMRAALQTFLVERGVDSRLCFAGNLARQPYMHERRDKWEVAGPLPGADKVMKDSLWVGVWPGLTIANLDHVADAIGTFFGRFE